jgi:hypothetical protein
MIRDCVPVRELAGWGFDDYEYRPHNIDPTRVAEASGLIAHRSPWEQTNAILKQETAALHDALMAHAHRPDLLAEMAGLSWSLGVVDLHRLIAFQRRLVFASQLARIAMPVAQDSAALLALSFGTPQPAVCDVIHQSSTYIVVQSSNPNLHLRTTASAAAPITLHAGSPFFEVASYRGRWFLRDGYHRACELLRAGVYAVPAVIVCAETLQQLGADHPWFFPEEILFSQTPPRVEDFLVDALNLDYDRPRLIKTIRITMEETLAPAPHQGETQ